MKENNSNNFAKFLATWDAIGTAVVLGVFGYVAYTNYVLQHSFFWRYLVN